MMSTGDENSIALLHHQKPTTYKAKSNVLISMKISNKKLHTDIIITKITFFHVGRLSMTDFVREDFVWDIQVHEK